MNQHPDATSPAAGINTTPRYPSRTIALSRSKISVSIPQDWHISDTMAAQRYGKGDPVKTNLALIQRVCLFDGARLSVDQIEEKISGKDWLQLLGEFFSDDEDGVGN